jgi:16S rRNA (adenine1518-N6/adenine1519-N6)-dimethyltransferase
MPERVQTRGWAKRRFGQHFLEGAWAAKLLQVISPQPGDAFIEIGPGRGAMTRLLAGSSRHVLAYEIDRDLVAELQRAAFPGVHVVQADFLDVTASQLKSDLAESSGGQAPAIPPRVVGNLPYNVASPILFHLVALFLDGVPIADATVMLQREVADRLAAETSTKEYGVLTVLIGHCAAVERVLQLPQGAFRPAPEVRSTVVRLRFHDPDPPVRDRVAFMRLVQAVFTRRRKTIANALLAYAPVASGALAAAALDACGIDPRRRPETLSIAELARLSDTVGPRAPAGP